MNRRYGTWKRSDEFSKSIQALPFYTRYRPVFRTISEPILGQLHQKLREQKCEFNFWDTIPLLLAHPLPDEIAFDLIERDIAISSLGHSPQSEAVLWRLAPLVEETILTLGKRFYTDSSRSLEEFEDALNQFAHSEWMLDSLSYCSASSLEKRRAYEKAIENHPKRENMLATNPKINPNQTAWHYFDLSRLAYTGQIEALYGAYDAQRFLDIARDDATPDEILHELEELRGVPGAVSVRGAAKRAAHRFENKMLRKRARCYTTTRFRREGMIFRRASPLGELAQSLRGIRLNKSQHWPPQIR